MSALSLRCRGLCGSKRSVMQVFVGAEARPRLQQAKGLPIDAGFVRRKARCLDGEDRVERVVRRINLQEVAIEEIDQMRQSRLFR